MLYCIWQFILQYGSPSLIEIKICISNMLQNEVEISSSANNDNWANFDELPR